MKKFSLLFSAFLIGSLLQAQNLPSYLPANGLVGWWPFNGNANDESGNGNNGIVNGATLTIDRFGNINSAFNFGGSEFISGNCSNFPSGNSARTVSIWYNANAISTGAAQLWGYGGLSCGRSYIMNFNNYDVPQGSYEVQGHCVNFRKYANSPIPFNGTWHNLILSYDGNQFRFYNNGTLVFTSSNSILDTYVASRIFCFGKQPVPDGLSPYTVPEYPGFNGKIDDIAIWNRALTQQEITNLYSASSGGGGSNNPYASLSWPQGISYQALARNAQGTPLLNTALQIRFSLLADSINGAVEYAESQNLNSNAQGLINTAFGSGTAITGTWAGINWAKGRKFLKVELNPGTGFVNLGVQELLSVPFSQRSRSAAVLENSSLPVFSGNAAALTGGLLPGQLYRTTAGVLMVVY
jgi:hypothetical protein